MISIFFIFSFILSKEKLLCSLDRLILEKKDLILIPCILFAFIKIILTSDKILFIFYMNIISLIVAILFSSYVANEIAITQILADMVFTIVLLKSNLKPIPEIALTKTIFFSIGTMLVIIIYHPGVNFGLQFPINTIEKIILDYRLIDTLFEILIFYLIGKLIYSKSKKSKIET